MYSYRHIGSFLVFLVIIRCLVSSDICDILLLYWHMMTFSLYPRTMEEHLWRHTPPAPVGTLCVGLHTD